MNYEIKGVIIVPRFIGMQEQLKNLSWTLGIKIELEVKNGFLFKTIRYKISGDTLSKLRKFEQITNDYFECYPIYLSPNTSISRRAIGSTSSEATEPAARGTDVETKPRWLGRLDALLGFLVFTLWFSLYPIDAISGYMNYINWKSDVIMFGSGVYIYEEFNSFLYADMSPKIRILSSKARTGIGFSSSNPENIISAIGRTFFLSCYYRHIAKSIFLGDKFYATNNRYTVFYTKKESIENVSIFVFSLINKNAILFYFLYPKLEKWFYSLFKVCAYINHGFCTANRFLGNIVDVIICSPYSNKIRSGKKATIADLYNFTNARWIGRVVIPNSFTVSADNNLIFCSGSNNCCTTKDNLGENISIDKTDSTKNKKSKVTCTPSIFVWDTGEDSVHCHPTSKQWFIIKIDSIKFIKNDKRLELGHLDIDTSNDSLMWFHFWGDSCLNNLQNHFRQFF